MRELWTHIQHIMQDFSGTDTNTQTSSNYIENKVSGDDTFELSLCFTNALPYIHTQEQAVVDITSFT